MSTTVEQYTRAQEELWGLLDAIEELEEEADKYTRRGVRARKKHDEEKAQEAFYLAGRKEGQARSLLKQVPLTRAVVSVLTMGLEQAKLEGKVYVQYPFDMEVQITCPCCRRARKYYFSSENPTRRSHCDECFVATYNWRNARKGRRPHVVLGQGQGVGR